MPRKKLTHPFQFELLRQQKDKDRIVRELKLRQRIYSFAKVSEKDRKRRFAFLIAEKRLTAERQYSTQLSESGELDSDSNLFLNPIMTFSSIWAVFLILSWSVSEG